MQEVRCTKCDKLLFKVKDIAKRNTLCVGGCINIEKNTSILEIKCPRCGTIQEYTVPPCIPKLD